MNHKGYSSLTLFLLASGIAAASQDPAAATTVASSQDAVPNIPAELTAPQPTAPVLQPPSDGIAPDPAASSAGPQGDPMQLPPAAPPGDPVQLPSAVAPADYCDSADCPAPGDKPAVHAAKQASAVHIGPPAQRALVESHDWAENPRAVPTLDAGGRVTYLFSESAPTIVCAPLHVCDIELQPGEAVQGAPHIGDSVRWRVSPAVSGGDDKRVTHLIVKPTESGLDTNLMIATDRRTYHLRLVSGTSRYVSSVGFDYPEEQQQAWNELAKAAGGGGGSGSGADMPTVAVNRLNFNYRIKVVKGKPTFKPLRAMDDGYHTYVAMNEDLPQGEAPALIGIGPSGEERMINYRLKGNLYVIDGTVFKMAFVAGVGGHQQRIELTRDPCKRRGWLGICWDARE